MKKGLGIILYVCGLLALFLFTSSPAQAVTTLKFGLIDSPGSALGQGVTMFWETCWIKTKGQVKINIGFSSAFGGWAALLSSGDGVRGS